MAPPTDDSKPFILYATFGAEGHMQPALQICSHLATRCGYDVTMLTGEDYKPRVESLGMRHQPLHGLVALVRMPEFSESLARKGIAALDPVGADTCDFIVEHIWTDAMPSMYSSFREALAAVKRRAGAREVLVVCDTSFGGYIPFRLGAELPEGFDSLPKSMGVAVVPQFLSSVDHAPFGTDLPPDTSESGRLRNRSLASFRSKARNPITGRTYRDSAAYAMMMCGVTRPVQEIIDSYGGPGLVEQPVWAASILGHDVTLLMCVPSLEYPASDRPAHVRFGGTLPRKPLPADIAYPPWWDEVLANSKRSGAGKRKKIVLVAQGTVEVDHNTLVIPTIRGLASHAEDVLVVAILCIKGATLDAVFESDAYRSSPPPSSSAAPAPATLANGDANGQNGTSEKHAPQPAAARGPLPPNARVVDYFPYDLVLEHADVFASNSGYGGYQHAAANGVPLVQAGVMIDKPEIGRRVVHAGMGVRVEGLNPAPSAIAAAVGEVLGQPQYMERAEEIRREVEAWDTMGMIERELEALWKGA